MKVVINSAKNGGGASSNKPYGYKLTVKEGADLWEYVGSEESEPPTEIDYRPKNLFRASRGQASLLYSGYSAEYEAGYPNINARLLTNAFTNSNAVSTFNINNYSYDYPRAFLIAALSDECEIEYNEELFDLDIREFKGSIESITGVVPNY